MIQPLIDAINFFVSFYVSLPFAIIAFINLVAALYIAAVIISIIQNS